MAGDAAAALPHFQRAAKIDADFLHFSILPQSILTYAGRALHQLGRLAEARQYLERSTGSFETDQMARLYLGLTLLGQDERDEGMRQTAAGLAGLHHWLEDIETYLPQGIHWDPAREIRSAIEALLRRIDESSPSVDELIEGGGWIGERMEQEIDLARRDEQRSRNRDG